MNDRVELARIELEIAEDLTTVTIAQILPWLRNRLGGDPRPYNGDQIIAWVERATAAVGRANRLKLRSPEFISDIYDNVGTGGIDRSLSPHWKNGG